MLEFIAYVLFLALKVAVGLVVVVCVAAFFLPAFLLFVVLPIYLAHRAFKRLTRA